MISSSTSIFGAYRPFLFTNLFYYLFYLSRGSSLPEFTKRKIYLFLTDSILNPFLLL